mmetsp:Transcript_94077/g.269336  ORF Transcript_94077/g.269336 Transcript_94077/m.269336 type:complete len:380 (+) Transcript_94077:615-1754(+)
MHSQTHKLTSSQTHKLANSFGTHSRSHSCTHALMHSHAHSGSHIAVQFPDGLEPVIAALHAKGFKYGHYTDAGEKACNLDAPMSEGYEHQDAMLFASWGIDMIKVDACATAETAEVLMARWLTELNGTGRPILFSNCRNGCLNDDEGADMQWQPWCTDTVNMWRTSHDIKATWASFLANLDTLKGRGTYGKPGSWNDPDILEVGVGEFVWDGTDAARNANRAHFSMWCMTSSPLLAGNDQRGAPEGLTSVLTNPKAISINQEYAGNAGDLLTVFNSSAVSTSTSTGMLEIWLKPLPNDRVALALLNREADRTAAPASITLELADLDPRFFGLGSTDLALGTCVAEDVWDSTTSTVNNQHTAEVPPSGVVLLVLSQCTAS